MNPYNTNQFVLVKGWKVVLAEMEALIITHWSAETQSHDHSTVGYQWCGHSRHSLVLGPLVRQRGTRIAGGLARERAPLCCQAEGARGGSGHIPHCIYEALPSARQHSPDPWGWGRNRGYTCREWPFDCHPPPPHLTSSCILVDSHFLARDSK